MLTAEEKDLLRHYVSIDDEGKVTGNTWDVHVARVGASTYVTDIEGLSITFTLQELREALEYPSLNGAYARLDPKKATDATALALLVRAACFAPGEPIPRALLVATLQGYDPPTPEPPDLLETIKRWVPGRAGPKAEAEVPAEERVKAALDRLIALGLLTTQASGDLVPHPRLPELTRGSAVDEEARAAVEETMLSEARRWNQSDDVRTTPTWQPHLRAITDAARERTDERAGDLCHEFGYHLLETGDLDGARRYYERALEIRKKVFGLRHPETANSLNNLGYLLQEMGKPAEARPYYEEALDIREEALGPEHPRTATSLNNLGSLLHGMGHPAEARPYYERALSIREKALGPKHPRTIDSLNNLGSLLRAMGNHQEARPYLERALQIREEVQGLRHPATAQSLNNLGFLLQAQGDLDGARPYYERALAIREEVLGPKHPDTALSLNNLGYLLQAQGNRAAARPYLERALAIREAILGPEHPDTAQGLNNLAVLCYHEGELEEAARLMRRAVAIQERGLGAEHPDTRKFRRNLGAILERMKDEG